MGHEPLVFTASLFLMLLLCPAFLVARTFDEDGGPARIAWCNRVCPLSAVLPPSPPPPPSPPVPSLICPVPSCPQPVCPAPRCPQPSCPAQPPPSLSCPPCPSQSPGSSTATQKQLPWKALKTYNATYLGFYKFYSHVTLDWFDAQVVCEEDGAHLVILDSEEEFEFVRSNMDPIPGWMHVGVHDLIREGQRMTVLGKSVDTAGYNKWLYGHEHDNIRLNCAWIKKTNAGMGMGPCHDKGPFVCELPIN